MSSPISDIGNGDSVHNEVQSTDTENTLLLENKSAAIPEDLGVASKLNEKGDIEESYPSSVEIDDNESKLRERIRVCRETIDNLRIELNMEKEKILEETKNQHEIDSAASISYCEPDQILNISEENFNVANDLPTVASIVDTSFNSRLQYDENLLEYEKQLQRYQVTLHMAQIEKKSALRKEMMAKAFKLKLLEVENQCNIELLKVKQSLQCLEPLQMIAAQWNSGQYNSNNLEKSFSSNKEMDEMDYGELRTKSLIDFNDFLNENNLDCTNRSQMTASSSLISLPKD